MAKKPEEILAGLQKQKEDIEILLSSLEEAYAEAGITEKHYNEVKTKNKKKLKETDKKIKKIEKKTGIKVKKETEEKKPKTVGELIAAEQGAVPISKPGEGEAIPGAAETPAPEMPAPATTPETPEPAPGPAKPGEKKFSTDDIKGMLSRFIKEIKPGGLEVLPKVEKMNVKLEKMDALLNAIKDEKGSRDETIRRLTEEIGEIRSNVGSFDRKVSQQEIIVNEINTSVAELKPQRFVKFLRKEDMKTKTHDSKIQRLEDINTLVIKRLTQVENVLKRIGSLEKIADFGKDISRRLVEIENREKRIGRISDKIDSIFMELNKRLDEFMLYKAKQDTLDELSREMMKAMDGINTKIEKYAEREDLDLLRDTLEGRIAGISTAPGAASPEVIKLQQQKEEIEGLLDILEEQFKKGDIKKEEYEKAKKINTERIDSIKNKIQAASQKQVAPIAQKEPESWDKMKPAPEPAKEEEPTKPALVTKPAREEKPEEVTEPVEEKRPEEPEKPEREDKKEMVGDLEESYKKGDISKGVLERVKKLLKKK